VRFGLVPFEPDHKTDPYLFTIGIQWTIDAWTGALMVRQVRQAPYPSGGRLAHSILTAAWHMLTDDVDYHDLGGDYFARLDPERAMRRIVRQANALGYAVRFDPLHAA
jgi:hypothetical protein